MKNLWKTETWFFGQNKQNVFICPKCNKSYNYKTYDIYQMIYCSNCGNKNIK